MSKKKLKWNLINRKLFIQSLIFGIVSVSITAAANIGVPLGFASQNGGTTGGNGGEVVKVSNKSDFAAAVSGSAAKIVEVSGAFDLDQGKYTAVGSNKTIVGVNGAKIQFGGIHLKGSKNVIIKNVEFHNPIKKSDNIYISDEAQNIWIDHCTFSGDPTKSNDQIHDHSIDIRTGATNITISYCEFHNLMQNIIIGGSNDNGAQDSKIKVTLHNNFFNGTPSRNPRIRFATVHILNNYFLDLIWPKSDKENGYGVASTCEAKVLLESNYFKNAPQPTVIGFTGWSPKGDLFDKNNIFVNCGKVATQGSAYDPGYPFTPDEASKVPEIAQEYAGAGKPERVSTKIKTHQSDKTNDELSISIVNSNELIIRNTLSGKTLGGTFTVYSLSGKILTQCKIAEKTADKTAYFILSEKLGTGNYYYLLSNDKSSYSGLLRFIQ